LLVEHGANLMIKTRAKTAVWHVNKDARIDKMIFDFKKKMTFRRFGLRLPAYY